MRVVIAARHPVGGIKTYLKYVHGCASMHDMDVFLVTPGRGDREYFSAAFPNVPFEHVETGDSVFAFLKTLVQTVIMKKPDLIHAHGFSSSLLMAPVAKLLGIPLIATTHDVFMDAQFRGVLGRIKRSVIGQLLRLPSLINPVGRDARCNLIETFPHLNRPNLVAIRNGIKTPDYLGKATRNLKAELGLSESEILLGFFGRFMSQKGFKILTDAASAYNDLSDKKVHIACFGWGGFIREEQERLKGTELERRIYYFDHTNDMPAVLRGVNAAVMPSRWEACPLLPMEALVAGVPVIASDCIGMKEVLEGTPAQIFKAGSANALREELAYFIATKVERQVSAENYREIAADRFNVDGSAQALRSLYNQVCSGETGALAC